MLKVNIEYGFIEQDTLIEMQKRRFTNIINMSSSLSSLDDEDMQIEF